MIVTCECGAKLKISDDKLTESGVKIRCPKCGVVHLLRKPAAPVAEPSAGGGFVPPPAPGRLQAAVASTLVLVAHDSAVVVDMIRNVLKDTGMAVAHAANGLEALKKATELRPQIMIVDVGLTGIYGFELCERLKGDAGTRHIKIVLLSSVYGLTAYKRSPISLYGADDYIEKHHIPDRLVPKLNQLLAGGPEVAHPAPVSAASSGEGPRSHGPSSLPEHRTDDVPAVPDVMPRVPVTLKGGRKHEAAPVSSTTAVRKPSPVPATVDAAPRAPAGGASAQRDGSVRLDASFFEQEEYAAHGKQPAKTAVDPGEIEKARKFARLIVSDVALYNQEAVAEGLRNGTFYELLRDDIAEGRALYDKRVPESVRATKDYYQEAFDTFIASKKNQR